MNRKTMEKMKNNYPPLPTTITMRTRIEKGKDEEKAPKVPKKRNWRKFTFSKNHSPDL